VSPVIGHAHCFVERATDDVISFFSLQDSSVLQRGDFRNRVNAHGSSDATRSCTSDEKRGIQRRALLHGSGASAGKPITSPARRYAEPWCGSVRPRDVAAIVNEEARFFESKAIDGGAPPAAKSARPFRDFAALHREAHSVCGVFGFDGRSLNKKCMQFCKAIAQTIRNLLSRMEQTVAAVHEITSLQAP